MPPSVKRHRHPSARKTEERAPAISSPTILKHAVHPSPNALFYGPSVAGQVPLGAWGALSEASSFMDSVVLLSGRPKTFREKSRPARPGPRTRHPGPELPGIRRREILAQVSGRVIDPGKSVLAGKAHRSLRAPLPSDRSAQSAAAAGAIPILLPVIQILPPERISRRSDSALGPLNEFDWVLFTSQTAVPDRLRTPGASPPQRNRTSQTLFAGAVGEHRNRSRRRGLSRRAHRFAPLGGSAREELGTCPDGKKSSCRAAIAQIQK